MTKKWKNIYAFLILISIYLNYYDIYVKFKVYYLLNLKEYMRFELSGNFWKYHLKNEKRQTEKAKLMNRRLSKSGSLDLNYLFE